MTTFITILGFLILISIILMLFANIYNNFQALLIKINESEANIDTTLRKRYDLINKTIGIIKNNKEIEEPLDLIEKLRSKKISNFELDRKLYDAINEVNNTLDKYPELKNLETIIKLQFSLNESEHEIEALRKYYNDNITYYNKRVAKIPSNFIALIFSYKNRPYYDGKDMTDNIINDFKI